ncbi:LysM peptidoglycan-binding domain-containing protein [bacterium]|nr:LysM peptidoglycan-binding domain-containing protein [bacterium]
MTRFRANVRALSLTMALGLAGGCTPPPGATDQTQADGLFESGMRREKISDYSGAVAAFEQALLADPQMARAHYEMATVFDKDLNQPVKALYHYTRALELNPELQGADIISNRLTDVKMRVAGDAVPQIGSPILENQINELQHQVSTLQAENSQLRQANDLLRQQLAGLQRLPTQPIRQVAQANNDSTPQQPTRDAQPYESRISTDPPPAGRTRPYVIRAGETIYGVSKDNGIKMDELKAANPGIAPENFREGRTIYIPLK